MIKNIILISMIFLISCTDKNEKISKYSNGNIKTVTPLNNKGQVHGEVIGYYENGVVEWKSSYVNDTLHGESLQYYTNGQLHYKSSFHKGKQEGDFIEYFEDGKLKEKGSRQKGLRQGLFLYYYHNGNKTCRNYIRK